jgi:hypothetical protein
MGHADVDPGAEWIAPERRRNGRRRIVHKPEVAAGDGVKKD